MGLSHDELQAALDEKGLKVGHIIEHDGFNPIGNGTPEQPLLVNVGADRYGRLWADDGDKVTLVLDPGILL